ncbi:hypothetical protein BJX76DRAFT_176083 [Aspergillus varians]
MNKKRISASRSRTDLVHLNDRTNILPGLAVLPEPVLWQLSLCLDYNNIPCARLRWNETDSLALDFILFPFFCSGCFPTWHMVLVPKPQPSAVASSTELPLNITQHHQGHHLESTGPSSSHSDWPRHLARRTTRYLSLTFFTRADPESWRPKIVRQSIIGKLATQSYSACEHHMNIFVSRRRFRLRRRRQRFPSGPELHQQRDNGKNGAKKSSKRGQGSDRARKTRGNELLCLVYRLTRLSPTSLNRGRLRRT